MAFNMPIHLRPSEDGVHDFDMVIRISSPIVYSHRHELLEVPVNGMSVDSKSKHISSLGLLFTAISLLWKWSYGHGLDGSDISRDHLCISVDHVCRS